MNSSPELFGIPVAVLALGVAGLGFLISLVALGWQVLKHSFDGGRVKVQFNAAAWEPGMMLTVERSGLWSLNADGQRPELIEVAQLVAENPGRTPVTIYSPGIAISGHGRKKHRISPRMFPLPDYHSDTAVTDTVYRLEPYDRVTFVLDYWSIMPRMKELAGRRTVTLRGVVEVAGKSGPRKSLWRRRWRIGPADWTAYRGVKELSPRMVMYRPLYISAYVDEEYKQGGLSRSMLGGVLFDAMEKFEERPDRAVFQAAMEESARRYSNDKPILGIAVWNMYEALDQRADLLGPWQWRPKPPADGESQLVDDEDHESTTEERTREPGITREHTD